MIPTIGQVQALDGKIFAMLTQEELDIWEFFSAQGRKYGLAVSIVNAADPTDIALTRSRQEENEVMRRANSTVSVQLLDS